MSDNTKVDWMVLRHDALDEPRFWESLTRAEMEHELKLHHADFGVTGFTVYECVRMRKFSFVTSLQCQEMPACGPT